MKKIQKNGINHVNIDLGKYLNKEYIICIYHSIDNEAKEVCCDVCYFKDIPKEILNSLNSLKSSVNILKLNQILTDGLSTNYSPQELLLKCPVSNTSFFTYFQEPENNTDTTNFLKDLRKNIPVLKIYEKCENSLFKIEHMTLEKLIDDIESIY
jgi:hypothetical protein